MTENGSYPQLSELSREALKIYETTLRANLEAEHLGEAVAIHPESGDYAVAHTHREAARSLRARHKPDGRVVVLTIGPPTDSDLSIVQRITGFPSK